MPRRANGQVITRKTKRGTVYALRFYAGGGRQYETLGTDAEGWTRNKAEDELAAAMAAVRAGTWTPRIAAAPIGVTPAVETFHVFASRWFSENRHGWSERTIKDYEYTLSMHVLPHFKDHNLTDITIQEVDRFRAAKLAEGKLAPAQVNKCLKRLSQILEVAEEYELIPRNPARGKRRKAKVPKVQRSWVEPEQALSLLAGGSVYMRPVIATLLGTGLRVSELCDLDWRNVNLATGTIIVGKAKTDAGSYREIDLAGGLIDELTDWKLASQQQSEEWQAAHPDQGAPVFLSAHAGRIRRQSSANVARRLKTAIRAANRRLDDLGIEQISERVTPHSLRRTYASLRAASGEDPTYIAEQLGHEDARFTLNVYTRAAKRRAKLHGAYLSEYEKALAWMALPTGKRALKGTGALDSVNDPRETLEDLAQ